jgi:hypothetical protein
VNTHGLAKLYDRLTPAERLPLIVAASSRGDAAERQRLVQSAPRLDVRLADHVPLAEALHETAMFHLVALLDLTAKFWQAWGLWGWSQVPQRHGRPMEETRLLGMAQLYAYHFTVHAEAWAKLCAELHVDPGALLDHLPGADIIQRTRERAKELAHTEEEATIFLRLDGHEGVMPPTVEGILGALRVLFQERAAWWDGGKG